MTETDKLDHLNRMIDGRLQKKKEEDRKKRKWLLLVLLLLLLAAVAGGCFLWKQTRPKSRFEMDRNALEGFLPGKSEEEIQAELNRIIEEGRANFSMLPNPVIRDGQMSVWIENVVANHYYIQADIYLYPEKNNRENAELLYSSGLLKQNSYIDFVDVDTDAAPGEYDGIAIFTAVDPDTLEEIGKASLVLVITVEE